MLIFRSQNLEFDSHLKGVIAFMLRNFLSLELIERRLY